MYLDEHLRRKIWNQMTKFLDYIPLRIQRTFSVAHRGLALLVLFSVFVKKRFETLTIFVLVVLSVPSLGSTKATHLNHSHSPYYPNQFFTCR